MSGILLDILIVLVAAKVAAEAAERVGVPAVVGEMLAGVVVGPSVMGLVEPGEVLRTLAELGVILLLLQVGLEMDLGELGGVGKAALTVAFVGVVLPFAAGYGVMQILGEGGHPALFMGAALTATSVGITARVFGDLRALSRVEARTVLGAAVADDVLGLVILTVVVRIVSAGSVSPATVVGVVAAAVGFLVVTTGVGIRLAPRLFELVQRVSRSPGTLVAVVLAFTLAVAELASAARLATIVGAFVAGLTLSGSVHSDRIRRDLTPLGHVFIPVFFLQIGIDTDVASLVQPRVLLVAAALLVVATLGKVISGAALLNSPGDKLLVGLGMLPRGEVGLIFAGIGLREGVLSDDLYASLLLVVLITTLVTPSLLSWRLGRLRTSPSTAATGPPPEDGWLAVEDGVVKLRDGPGQPPGRPPPHAALHLGFQAALLASTARPAPALLDWLGSLGDTPVTWDRAARRNFFELLSGGNARSWRFLEMTGLLAKALPEVADAVRVRRADPAEVDPSGVLRFDLVDAVHELLGSEELTHPEWLVLAALLVDVGASVSTARRVVKRLDMGAAAEQEVALLVGESDLLRAAAARADGLDEERVIQIASHLDRPERARALYLLSLALGDLEPWHRQRLDALEELVEAALVSPALAGRDARNLVEQRRAAAIRVAGAATPAARRLEHAPHAWLLNQEPEVAARLARLLEPPPPRGNVRVETVALGEDRFRVEVACRDRRGLLASIAGGLARGGLEVLEASVATWPDGATADAFVVSASEAPDPEELRRLLTEARKEPLAAAGSSDAEVSFDDNASPWYTLCSVQVPDRPGLLHSLATAFAASGADVHSARITTDAGTAHDRFELTNGGGSKLGTGAREGITRAVKNGVGRTGARRRAKPARDGNKGVIDRKQLPHSVTSDSTGHRGGGVGRLHGSRLHTRDDRGVRRLPQPALDHPRSDLGHLHAGRLRLGGDRLLPGQARRSRGDDQLHDLRTGLRRLLPGRLRHHVRGLHGDHRCRRRPRHRHLHRADR